MSIFTYLRKFPGGTTDLGGGHLSALLRHMHLSKPCKSQSMVRSYNTLYGPLCVYYMHVHVCVVVYSAPMCNASECIDCGEI